MINSKHAAIPHIWNSLSLFVLIFFCVIGVNTAFKFPNFSAEADSYIIATISMQQHGSLDIRAEDILKLEEEMSNHSVAKTARDKFENNRHNSDVYNRDVFGKLYPWYMGTYSISVFPVKAICKIFGFPYTHIYQINNIIYYLLALLTVFFFLKQSRKHVFFTILLLVCSPAFYYITWASAEVFIGALLIASLVFFANRNHYLAALFAAIAATLNIAIAGYCLVICVDYLISVYCNEKQHDRKRNIADMAKSNWKKITLFALCLIPALITPLWNIYHYRKITPQINQAGYDVLWLKRFIAYLFDFNLGFLPYFPVLLVLFFIIILSGTVKKDRFVIMGAIGFFLTVFLYSAITNIDCDMTIMARYNAWSFPFLVIIVVVYVDKLFEGTLWKQSVNFIVIFSAGVSAVVTVGTWRYNRGAYMHLTPAAEFVLDNLPALYNPLPSTFVVRNKHDEDDYDHLRQVIPYFNKAGYLRKIYVPSDKLDTVIYGLAGNADELQDVGKKIEKMKKSNKSYHYINLPNSRLNIKGAFYELGKVVDITKQSSIYQINGWGPPELVGAWTIGHVPILSMLIDSKNDLMLNINVAQIFTEKPVEIYINEFLLGEFTFVLGENAFEIPAAFIPDENLKIRFSFKDLQSPKDKGMSEDSRKLGMYIVSFSIDALSSYDINAEYDIELEAEMNVEGFVARMYRNVFGRKYDQSGLDLWVAGLLSGNETGATIAEYFFFGWEFIERNVTDLEFLVITYKALMNRDGDEESLEFWLGELERGAGRRHVLIDMIDSDEFKDICKSYGIEPGQLNHE